MNFESNTYTKSDITHNKLQLSAYTIADNCTDTTDLQDGINEIHFAIKELQTRGKKAPSYFYSRLQKLENKLKKKQSANLITLSVNIRFKVDSAILELAIRHCINTHIPLTKKNIITTIKNRVYEQGSSILQSSESSKNIQLETNQAEFQKAFMELCREFNL